VPPSFGNRTGLLVISKRLPPLITVSTTYAGFYLEVMRSFPVSRWLDCGYAELLFK
jgi:hypothetical protein